MTIDRGRAIYAGLATVLLVSIAAAVRGQRTHPRTGADAPGISAATQSSASAPPVVPSRPPYGPARWPTAAAGAPPPPADVVARGAAVYDAHCASCHGASLEGQPNWKIALPDGSLPAPPHDIDGHTWHHGDAELLRIIGQGGTIYMPESKMPGYAGTLSDDEMRAILAFIKTHWGAKELSWQAGVTAGEVGPGTAP